MTLAQLDAVLLVGGFGTRLQSVVSDRPKPLAEIAGKPFLTYQFEQLVNAGVRRAVLCTGFRGSQVESQYGSHYGNMALSYSLEPEPLGTGGAIRYALEKLQSSPVLVMNGDSYCHANLGELLSFHRENDAEISMLLAEVPNTERYGQVNVDGSQRVCEFREKGAATGAGAINAGIYLIERDLLDQIPAGRAVSLEREMFPQWVGRKFFGMRTNGRFLDIGTPESYAAAAEFFATLPK